MLRTLYFAATPGNRSVSTFTTTARPARSRAVCATRGATVRHGPPGRPEVRKNRDLALANHFVELLFVDFDRFADCRQLRLAGTAFANIGKVLRGNAIGPTASRAISNQRHGSILGHQSSGRPAERITQPYFGLTSFISSILPAVDVASRGSSQTPREAFHYSVASSGRSVLERSRAGVTNGQSAFRASGDVTFRYLMRTGIIAS